jgi:hypothetical protein
VCKAKKRKTEHEGKQKEKRTSGSPGTVYMEAAREIRAIKLLVNFEKWKYKSQETWSNVL